MVRNVAEEHQGFAVLCEPVGEDGLVEGVQVHFAALEPQQELRAVAELEDAVLRESVQVHVLRSGSGLVRDFGGLPVQDGAHALGDVQQACAAAVHHARLLQDVQLFGRMLQRQVHRGDQVVEILVQVLAARRGLRPFPEHGQDGALHGLGDGVVGFLDTGEHGAGESFRIGLMDIGQAFGEPGEHAGKDDAGVAPGAHQHPGGDGFRHLGEGETGP